VKLFELASTSRIFAPGAMACAHWTSRLISSAQPALVRGYVEPPLWLTLVKQPFDVVQAGSPKVLLKRFRSASAVGSS
jgi:hypothetical protein